MVLNLVWIFAHENIFWIFTDEKDNLIKSVKKRADLDLCSFSVLTGRHSTYQQPAMQNFVQQQLGGYFVRGGGLR